MNPLKAKLASPEIICVMVWHYVLAWKMKDLMLPSPLCNVSISVTSGCGYTVRSALISVCWFPLISSTVTSLQGVGIEEFHRGVSTQEFE